ncbi:NAD(P)-dependent oxidoreductase [Actinoplanes sp. NPDC004185]
MSRIVVIGGTGYAGSAIVAEAAARGHEVTAFSRSLPADAVAGVNYVQGDATEEAALSSVISGADVVVAALAPRGPLADSFRDVYRTVARLADAAGLASSSSAASRPCVRHPARPVSKRTSATPPPSSTPRSLPAPH